jgi:hypothetical protein
VEIHSQRPQSTSDQVSHPKNRGIGRGSLTKNTCADL